LGNDTLVASIGNFKKFIPIITNELCSIEVIEPQKIKFTIRASEHNLVSPTRKNYRVPIYITANQDISGFLIDKLVLEIDKNIFNPKSTDNGILYLTNEFFPTIEMAFANVQVPDLKADSEIILLTLRGDILLGSTDSSGIILREVQFSDNSLLDGEPELINGFLTTEICEEGSDRYIELLDFIPGVFVLENPVSDILKVECKTAERGKHTLEVVDLQGNTIQIEEFIATKTKNEFTFDNIDISNFGNGNYFIIMSSPIKKYYDKFIIAK
jgi:hypothetical protein